MAVHIIRLSDAARAVYYATARTLVDDDDHGRWRSVVDAAMAPYAGDVVGAADALLLCVRGYQVEHMVRVWGIDPDEELRDGKLSFDGEHVLARAVYELVLGFHRSDREFGIARYHQSGVVAALLRCGAHVDPGGRVPWCGGKSPFEQYVTTAQPGADDTLRAFMAARGADATEFWRDARSLASMTAYVDGRWTTPLCAYSRVRSVVFACRRRLPRELVRECAAFLGVGLCPRAPAPKRGHT